MTYKGKIKKLFANKIGWSCFSIKLQNGKSLVAKGKVPPGMTLFEGASVEIEGRIIKDPKYGEQIEINSISMDQTSDADYLSHNISCIGPVLAEKIVEELGNNCLDKIMADPKILLTVKGIKKKKFEKIEKSIKDQFADFALIKEINKFFNGNITPNQQQKIIELTKRETSKKKYRKPTEERVSFKEIKKNPYILITHIDGFGFKTVDSLALSSGLDPYGTYRIAAALITTLQNAAQSEGHCFLDFNDITNRVMDLVFPNPDFLKNVDLNKYIYLLNDDEDAAEDFINSLPTESEVRTYADIYIKIIDKMVDAITEDEELGLLKEEDSRLYLMKYYNAEKKIAENVNEAYNSDPVIEIDETDMDKAIKKLEYETKYDFSLEQNLAVKNSLAHRLSIITGGPGRGKTTIIKAIISSWLTHSNNQHTGHLLLLAPTGKAAKRMEESTGFEAQTIDRFFVGLEKSFKMNNLSDKPVESFYKDYLIIVDESSMIGIEKAAKLIKFQKYANLIFVGDVDQLESIEPGMFLKDMILSGKVSVSKLTKGYRNEGSISYNAEAINRGCGFKDYKFDEHTIFIESENSQLLTSVLNFYKTMLEKYPASDIGILTPMRQRGTASVNSINKAIQEAFNPPTKQNPKNETGYLVNDRVMCTKNLYQAPVIRKNTYGYFHNETEESGVFNGDIGTITKIDRDLREMTIHFDDDRIGIFSFTDIKLYFEMAYATTIHKSQGSEYKAVLTVVSSESMFFLRRNLIYTAYTRAKDILYILGDKKAITVAAKKEGSKLRNTTLRKRIKNEL